MSNLQQTNSRSGLINELVSPYSILRYQPEESVNDTIEKTTYAQGPRGNRAQLLRQLALQKKFEDKPFLQKNNKPSKEDAMLLGEDPNLHSLNYDMDPLSRKIAEKQANQGQQPRIPYQPKLSAYRVRNNRGEYQTVNSSKLFQEMDGVVAQNKHQRNVSTAEGQKDYKRKISQEKTKAETRLRMVEKISKYRENKIRQEFHKLEEELKVEDDKRQQEYLREQKREMYMERQRQKLFDHRLKQQQENAQFPGQSMMGGGVASDPSFNVPNGMGKNTLLDPIGFVEEQRDSREQSEGLVTNIEIKNTHGQDVTPGTQQTDHQEDNAEAQEHDADQEETTQQANASDEAADDTRPLDQEQLEQEDRNDAIKIEEDQKQEASQNEQQDGSQ